MSISTRDGPENDKRVAAAGTGAAAAVVRLDYIDPLGGTSAARLVREELVDQADEIAATMVHTRSGRSADLFTRFHRSVESKARDLLESVGLGSEAETEARTLSHGDQRALDIAPALATKPKLLLLDEPTEGLAPVIVGQLGTWLDHLREEGFGVLLAEQNAVFALRHADRGSILEKGRIRHEASAADLRGSEALLESLGVSAKKGVAAPADLAPHAAT